MTNTTSNDLEVFMWERQPQAERLVRELADKLLAELPEAAEFARRLHDESGNRFHDLIETIRLAGDSPHVRQAEEAGWSGQDEQSGWRVMRNPDGVFPIVAVAVAEKLPAEQVWIDLKVDFVADFLSANGLTTEIVGEPGAMCRWAKIWEVPGRAMLGVTERHGSQAMPTADQPDPPDLRAVMKVLESFRTRRRDFETDDEGFAEAERLIDQAIAALGRDYACALWFAAEREYWMRRNRAAQVQYARQQRLGIGWANHDHHTYRSSRQNFTKLVVMWEKLGFHCRERFYAGREAGWGAQVMEQPAAGIVTFNDVDLSPEELLNDFAHEPLPPLTPLPFGERLGEGEASQARALHPPPAPPSKEGSKLGTVGLWCGLHGDSFLQAGMHHLECQFDFDALKQQLETQDGVKVMKPFTDFPYLRQAFTEGERWKVRPQRIERLLAAGLIDESQARQFREQGAIGSHLENLERNEGFKGFNQSGVSEIIRETDPRRHLAAVT